MNLKSIKSQHYFTNEEITILRYLVHEQIVQLTNYRLLKKQLGQNIMQFDKYIKKCTDLISKIEDLSK